MPEDEAVAFARDQVPAWNLVAVHLSHTPRRLDQGAQA
jgi:predicted FMN-binding regulatory protein PaiB